MYKNIKEKLLQLSNKTLAVATNANYEYGINVLTKLNILDKFKKVVGYNNVANAKPAPDMLDLIMQELSFDTNSNSFNWR